ncbi:MAG: sn-glycerol-3-phosphate ABC transporter ATP-binding protein UgpC [Proteobacteria bacterium]|nr:sn-glycerol-3-phosphate ABC transporter ATP-binding protein UgpC [Pseudomonadota bacterium]
MAKVELIDICKSFGDVKVVHHVDLTIEDAEFIVLVGPSGCGKSTVLRMVAGLEGVTSGEIRIGDHSVNDVSPKDRNVAMVFQNYALYPHMSVRENMGFSLKMAKRTQAEIAEEVAKAAAILELEKLLDRKPSELSGGQRQRVAMGRAIVRQPDVFLFDEPLSNLDAQLRTQMRMELRKMHLKFQTTTIYVTHDQIEAMTLADRIVILKDGYIQQVGTPVEVYEKPANVFVAKFIGNPSMNILQGMVAIVDGERCVRAGKKSLFPLGENWGHLADGQPVLAGLRPDAIKMGDRVEALPTKWQCSAEVVLSETLGGHSLLELVVDGEHAMLAEVEGRVLPSCGETVPIGFEFDRMVLFDPETGTALS